MTRASKRSLCMLSEESTPLQDALQEVPELLQHVSNSIEVRNLRQVCKSASIIALNSVTSYCIRLSPQPSKTESLPSVANLLKHTRLHHLRVEFTVSKGSRSLTTSQDLGPHLPALRRFTSEMQAALRTVTSLDLCLDLTEHQYEDRFKRAAILPRTRSSNGQSATAQFATLLANACPNLNHLGAKGAVNAEIMQVFANSLPKLTSLEILDSIHPPWQSHYVSQDQLLPHLTHLKKPQTQCQGDVQQICKLFQCPALTHLEVGEGMLQGDSQQWIQLPPQLKVLKCKAISLYTSICIPLSAQLQHLESIHVSGSCMSNPNVGIGVLSDLLESAPALQVLSLCACMNTLVIQDSCLTVLGQMKVLHARMQAGLRLEGVTLHCTSNYREEETEFASYNNFLSMSEVLGHMPRLEGFVAVELLTLLPGGKFCCLGFLASVFPNVQTLLISGPWQDADFSDHECASFNNLRVFHSFSEELTATSIVRLAACMPALTLLQHRNSPIDREYRRLPARLRAIQSQTAGGAGRASTATRLGDWTLEKKGIKITKWGRAILPSGVSPCTLGGNVGQVLPIPDPWFLYSCHSHNTLMSMGREKISVL